MREMGGREEEKEEERKKKKGTFIIKVYRQHSSNFAHIYVNCAIIASIHNSHPYVCNPKEGFELQHAA